MLLWLQQGQKTPAEESVWDLKVFLQEFGGDCVLEAGVTTSRTSS